MILEKMIPGAKREIDCHCVKCYAPMVIGVRQQYQNVIIVDVCGAKEKKPDENWYEKMIRWSKKGG